MAQDIIIKRMGRKVAIGRMARIQAARYLMERKGDIKRLGRKIDRIMERVVIND
jgi:hypothetical protein